MVTGPHALDAVEFKRGRTPSDTQIIWNGLPKENSNGFKQWLSVPGNTYQDKEHFLKIDDKKCGKWLKDWGEGYSHHASIGDNGTTASISRYGDVMQVTQYLGKGISGVFSIDQSSVQEPYQVAARADDLEELSKTSTFGAYTFGIGMEYFTAKEIPTVKWVNWRWPRYEWQKDGMRVIFQYMVHEGVVLHQLLFDNQSGESQDLPDFWLAGDLKISDLDYLHPEPEHKAKSAYLMNNIPGPYGYGRVTVKSIDTKKKQNPAETERYQALALIDIFIDGKRESMPKDQTQALGKLPHDHFKEIVVAYKLSGRPDGKVSWTDLIIPAKHCNVSKFLQEELKMAGDRDVSARSLLLTPQPVPLTTEAEGLGVDAPSNTATASPAQPEDTQKPPSKTAPVLSEPPNDDSGTVRLDEKPITISDKIGYLAWRHLEHILSVCAIPILDIPTEEQADERSDSSRDDSTALVALTCGDMSGHRVCTSASFYAFRFLVDVERRIASTGVNNHDITALRDRIQTTCEGHIKWLGHVWEKENHRPLEVGCFAANYWVTGKKMPRGSATWQPDDATTDTALQILKITDYARMQMNSYPSTHRNGARNELEWLYALVTKIFVSWLVALDKLDVRAKYAWPHSKEDGMNTFRLEDHFWIWKALKSMEELEMWTQLPSPITFKKDDLEPLSHSWSTKEEKHRMEIFLGRVGQREGFLKLTYVPDYNTDSWKQLYQNFHMISKRIAPDKVLRGVLQRFTTTNDVSGSRMLAVKRSPRDIQFLLDNRDNALILNQLALDGKPFFADLAFKELWEQTINAQPFHLENEEDGTRWYYVTRYLLSMLMGIQSKSLNEKEPCRALKDSRTTLLRFFGHNGFIGAHLDENREPVLFWDKRDRDSYYHASFEVIYKLHVLTHSRQTRIDAQIPLEAGDTVSEILRHVRDISSNFKFTAGAKVQSPGRRPGDALVMKANIPSNLNIDTSNTCIVEEEEWIYNFPEFLSTSTICPISPDEDCDDSTRSNSDIFGGASSQTARSVRSETTEKTSRGSIHQRTKQISRTFIADAKKQKLYGQPRTVNSEPWIDAPWRFYDDYEELKQKLEKPRTARDAKKRFIWIPQANRNENARNLCRIANTPEAEIEAISLFFDRHVRYENLYYDDTALALNSWQTELNLSFHLLDAGTSDTKGTYWDWRPKSNVLEAPKLNRASMGYRFDGDLFDHYWTCHFVESVPGAQADSSDSSKPSSEDENSVFESYTKSREHFKQWWQRKILELLLTHRILEKQAVQSRRIIRQVDHILGKFTKSGAPAGTRYEMKISASGIWELGRDCEEQLQKVADDLKSTLQKTEEWNDREKNRGEERPRWTLNHEKKYGKRIRELQTLVEQDQRDLRNRCSDVEVLQKRFESERRGQREAQHDRNVRWFTYVTIVFAPLSFAEGFYSMGGAPGYELIVSLVKFCFSALAVTVAVILLTIKTLPFLKKWKDNITGKEDEETPWDKTMLSILESLVISLLYPKNILESEPHGLLDSAMLALAFTVGVIFDIVFVPVFILYWLVTFLVLNLRDLCILVERHWPNVSSEKQGKREGSDQDGAAKDAASSGKMDKNFESKPKDQKVADLESGPSEQPTSSSRRFDKILEDIFNRAICPPRLLHRWLKAP